MLLRTVLALTLPLAACASDPETPPAAPSAEAPPPANAPAPADTLRLAPTITDTLVVEGYPEPVTLRLVRQDEGPLPFATYAAETITFEHYADEASGQTARFILGEQSTPYHSILRLHVPSEEALELGKDDPEAYLRGLAGSNEVTPMPDDPAPWVEAAYLWYEGDRSIYVRAGTHAGRRFYLIENMQEEMGDGFGPHAVLLLDHWRWLPEGMLLTD